MNRPPEPSPLEPAVERLCEVLDRKETARRWYERYVATLGTRAVIDTANDRAVAWVHRRVAGSD